MEFKEGDFIVDQPYGNELANGFLTIGANVCKTVALAFATYVHYQIDIIGHFVRRKSQAFFS